MKETHEMAQEIRRQLEKAKTKYDYKCPSPTKRCFLQVHGRQGAGHVHEVQRAPADSALLRVRLSPLLPQGVPIRLPTGFLH